jgi:hypothetical protein
MVATTYRDLNLPNTTIRDSFTPRISTLSNNRQITYVLKAPYFLQKSIELEATNGVGYTRPDKKYGKDISGEELTKYLGKMDRLVEHQKLETKNCAFENMTNMIDDLDSLVMRYIKFLEAEAIMKKKLNVINEYLVQNYGKENLMSSEQFYDFINENKKDKQKEEENIPKEKKKRSLLSRIFN